MHLIAGLGNPSLRYRHTRHNAGFDALDVLSGQYGISIRKKEHFAITGAGNINGRPVLLIKPQTYMNRSGESILSAMKAYNISPGDMIILVDDILLEYGQLRIRAKGSAGGHNGLKSIISLCGTQEFTRIRIGMGPMPEGADQIRFVLSKPARADLTRVRDSYLDVSKACDLIISGNISQAMNLYNGKSGK